MAALQDLQSIHLEDAFWQGWREDLHTLFAKASYLLDATSSSEGEVAEYLNQLVPQGFPKQFVPQAALPTGMAYEAFIYQQHRIPTRDGLHDFFNGLCWQHFPKVKLHFNHLHQVQIERLGTGSRGKVRDRITIIDENGFLIACPDALWEALQQKAWIRAFVELRELWQESKVMVFGHALLEKLVFPYKAITAHAIRVPFSALAGTTMAALDERHSGEVLNAPQVFSTEEIARIDGYLSEFLSEEVLAAATKPYIPVQVFGIPGWSTEVQNLNFYQDSQVFREPK